MPSVSAATVEEAGHQARHPVQMREDPVQFIAGQNHGKAFGLCRPLHSLQRADLFLEHLLVEEPSGEGSRESDGQAERPTEPGAKESKSRALKA